MKVLVPMAGDSRRFEEAGHSFPKNLVEIEGLPLVERVLERVRGLGDLVCLVRDDENRRFHTADVIRLLVPGAESQIKLFTDDNSRSLQVLQP